MAGPVLRAHRHQFCPPCAEYVTFELSGSDGPIRQGTTWRQQLRQLPNFVALDVGGKGGKPSVALLLLALDKLTVHLTWTMPGDPEGCLNIGRLGMIPNSPPPRGLAHGAPSDVVAPTLELRCHADLHVSPKASVVFTLNLLKDGSNA